MTIQRSNHAIPIIRPLLLLLCCLALGLSACVAGKSASSDDDTGSRSRLPSGPNDVKLAYGVTVNVPSAYTVAGSLSPDAANKAALDSRRKGGERILLLEAAGAPSPRAIEPMIALFLVNQEGTFMPLEYAQQIKPEELAAIGKELIEKEKAEAKKKKKPAGLLDLQISRETVNGKVAIVQRMLVAGPDGKPARLTNWDIYLPDGAGLAVKSVYDQNVMGSDSEIGNIVRSIRVQ